MTLISASHLEKSYGGHVCFGDVNFRIGRGSRIGLIGPNGCGKTTLFRVLTGEESCDGELARRRNLTIARLDQTPTFPAGATPRSVMHEAIQIWRDLEHEIHALRDELPDLAPPEQEAALSRLADLEARLEAGDGDSALRRAEALLTGVGLPEACHDQEVSTLSGGETCRLSLARLLLNEPDLWLLDEPTNHLDLAGITFLERFLQQSAAAVVVISHDRRFLDHVTNETWELEAGNLYLYPGNYHTSRRLREERRMVQWREFMKQRDYMRREEVFINKWRAGTRSRQAQSRMKRLARVERIAEPQDQSRLAALDLHISRRLGDLVMEANALEVGYPGRTLFSDLTMALAPGEIVGVVGPNGAGKTSFFKTVLGGLPPLAGTLRWGPTAETGVLGQHDYFDDDNRTPLEYLQDCNLGNDDQDRRDKLGAMLFTGEEAYKPIRILSGGEKKRLMLTRLLLEGHNVLLLDEPTNHLDIRSAEAVTLALSAYPGTVVVISHDRYFLDEVADRILWLEDGRWRLVNGGFSEAAAARENWQRDDTAAAPDRKVRQVRPQGDASGADSSRSTFAGWRTNRLESAIIANEERMAAIHALFSDPEVIRNGNQMRNLQNELEEIERRQAELEEEYARRA